MKAIAFALLLTPVFWHGSGNAATLTIVDGELRGATGVQVGGTPVEVVFADSTCLNSFPSDSYCNGVTPSSGLPPFYTELFANLAGQALLEQVFLDSHLGSFDSNPSAVFGCEATSYCESVIPFKDNWPNGILSIGVRNAGDSSGFTDELGVTTTYGSWPDLAGNGQRNYAVFTPVPEPTTAVLVSLGLIGLGARRRS